MRNFDMGPHGEKPANEVVTTSSTPLELPEKQEALFREVLTLFEGTQRCYAVAGAFALREHTGICRFTKDLDVFLEAKEAAIALAQLQDYGFTCEVCDPVWLAKAHRDGFFVDLITGMSNGVISVDEEWIERAKPAKVVGVETRVLAPEELVASKLFVTRRERFDGADIAHIIYASRGDLRWERILELAGEHWELVLWALVLYRYAYPAQAGRVPLTLWKQLLSRYADGLQRTDPEARFRGSLIDDAMFAIDVKEWGLDDLFKESRERSIKISPLSGSKCA